MTENKKKKMQVHMKRVSKHAKRSLSYTHIKGELTCVFKKMKLTFPGKDA